MEQRVLQIYLWHHKKYLTQPLLFKFQDILFCIHKLHLWQTRTSSISLSSDFFHDLRMADLPCSVSDWLVFFLFGLYSSSNRRFNLTPRLPKGECEGEALNTTNQCSILLYAYKRHYSILLVRTLILLASSFAVSMERDHTLPHHLVKGLSSS